MALLVTGRHVRSSSRAGCTHAGRPGVSVDGVSTLHGRLVVVPSKDSTPGSHRYI